MRVFDLASLPTTPQGSTADGPGPLMLTTCVREASHQAVFEYWARCVGGTGDLPRVEVDWRSGLLPASRRLLERLRDLRGRAGVVVSVHVIADGVDLDAVGLTAPLVDFDHLAIRCSRPAKNGRLRRLAELARSTLETVGDEWQRRAVTVGVEPDSWRLLAPQLRGLLDPAEIVEAANALAEVQLEGLAPERWVDAVRRQLLVRLMGSQAPREFIALLAVATARGDVDAAALDELREQDLVRDGQLVRWAAWLAEGALIEGLFGPGAPLPSEGQRTPDWKTRVDVAGKWVRDRHVPEWTSPDFIAVSWSIASGELDTARLLLDGLAPRLDDSTTGDAFKADFFLCLGRLRMAEGRAEAALDAGRAAVRWARSGDLPTEKLITCLEWLGAALGASRNAPRHAGEAEMLIREAIALERASGTPDEALVGELEWLGDTLAQQDRWMDAVEVLRDAHRHSAGSREHRSLCFHLARILSTRAPGRDEAIRIYEELVHAAPSIDEVPPRAPIDDRYTAHLAAGQLLSMRGDHAAARSHLATALRIADEAALSADFRAAVRHSFAIALERDGEPEKARIVRAEAIALIPIAGPGPLTERAQLQPRSARLKSSTKP